MRACCLAAVKTPISPGKDTPEHFKSFKEFETLFVELAEDHGYDLGMVDDVLSVMKYWKTDEEFTRQVGISSDM